MHIDYAYTCIIWMHCVTGERGGAAEPLGEEPPVQTCRRRGGAGAGEGFPFPVFPASGTPEAELAHYMACVRIHTHGRTRVCILARVRMHSMHTRSIYTAWR